MFLTLDRDWQGAAGSIWRWMKAVETTWLSLGKQLVRLGTEERRPLETCWFFLLKKFFPHSFRAVVQKTRILYSQSGRKDESYSKIIQGHKYNDKDKDTDKVPEKPNMLYFWNPDDLLSPNMMIDTSLWSSCSPGWQGGQRRSKYGPEWALLLYIFCLGAF